MSAPPDAARHLRGAADQPQDTPVGWSNWIRDRGAAIAAAGQWRSLRSFDALGPTGVLDDADNTSLVSFGSNDYLGLSCHPTVIEAAATALDRWGTGAGASRLICGSRPVHRDLEDDLAAWKRTESALVFSSGFAANQGVLGVLGGPGVLIVSDELNHASIIDGARLARAEVAVFPHLDLDAAAGLVAGWPGRCVVVSDSVFSMDGDAADLDGLVEVCARSGAALVIDEAHSVWGPDLGEIDGFPGDRIPIVRVGTLSKTLGALGGFAASSRAMIELLVNSARPFIFSTGLTPADAASAQAALGIVRSQEGQCLTERLRHHVDRLAAEHPSPIVPLVLGDEAETLAASEALAKDGLWVPAIRPPTVAPGTSRLRLTFSAAHTDAQVDHLLAALNRLDLR